MRKLNESLENLKLGLFTLTIYLLPILVHAQSLEGRISDAISRLIIILNLLLVGVIAWAGFMLATGEQAGLRKLAYSVGALIVVNSSRLIIDFFI